MTPSVFTTTAEVDIGTEKVVLHELPWQGTCELVKRIQGVAIGLFKQDAAGNLHLDFDDIGRAIAGSVELVEFVVTQSARRDEKWFASLGTSQVLALLDTALEVNLTDHLKGILGKIGGRFARFAPALAARGQSMMTRSAPSATS